MPDETTSVKRARNSKTRELPKRVPGDSGFSPKAVHNLESHALTAREQIMRNWPENDWEIR